MLLLVSDADDSVVDYLETQIKQRGILCHRLNIESFPDDLFSFCIEGGIISSGYQYPITGVFARFFKNISGKTLNSIPSQYRIFVEKELHDALMAPLLSLGDNIRWINKTEANFRASVKLAQLQVAYGVGLNIPDTIVSSSSAKLTNFFREKEGRVVTKAIHQGWVSSNPDVDESEVVFTNLVAEEHLSKLDPIKNYPPLLFQEQIEIESEFRVVVINGKCFSCQLGKVQGVDWRKDLGAVFGSSTVDLPEPIAQKCVEVVCKLGLSLGVIDLVLDKQGKYIFLEVNPRGGWLWMETKLGYPISKHIIDYLEGK